MNFVTCWKPKVPVDCRTGVVGGVDGALLERRENFAAGQQESSSRRSPANPSAIMPPGTRSFRSLKSAIVRIGFFEWMMFGPWCIRLT
jgi:hypothetical protein